MTLHKAHIFTVLLMIPLLAACSTAAVKQERLIYLSPSSAVPLGAAASSASVSVSASVSAKAESKKSASDSSSKYRGNESGSSNSGSSKKSSASSETSETSKNNTGSSGSGKSDKSSDRSSPASSATGSSSVASSATSSGGAAIPTEGSSTVNDIVSLYNCALQKNAALSGVQFRFSNYDSLRKKQSSGIIKFNNSFQNPVFLLATDQAGYVYYTAADQSFYFYQGGCWLLLSKNSSIDTTQYVMIVDPELSAANVNTYSFTRVNTNRVIDLSLSSGFEKYAEIFQIFNVSGSIQKVQMEYTLSSAGYIIGEKQVFTLSDTSELSMEKSYLDIGNSVDLTQNISKP